MTLYALKPACQTRLRPLARTLAAHGFTANQITLATVALSAAVGALVALNADKPIFFLAIPLALAVRIPLNIVDGLMARECRQKSVLGGYLNELGDVVSDAALMLPFAWVAPLSPLAVGLLILLTILTEYAGALGLAFGGERRFDGPLGKSDRSLLLAVAGLWIASGRPLPEQGVVGVIALAALLMVTLVRRVRAGMRSTATGADNISKEGERS